MMLAVDAAAAATAASGVQYRCPARYGRHASSTGNSSCCYVTVLSSVGSIYM